MTYDASITASVAAYSANRCTIPMIARLRENRMTARRFRCSLRGTGLPDLTPDGIRMHICPFTRAQVFRRRNQSFDVRRANKRLALSL